jgi:hypothetical protein
MVHGLTVNRNPEETKRLITCQLTKLETALDQLKKTYTKLMPADAALLASALTLTGRHAIALYEGEQYVWPNDNDKLTKAMVGQVLQVQEAIENNAPKKVSKNAPEEEPVTISVGLMPNFSAGENLLVERDDLKTVLSDILQEGVEFAYSPIDIGWQWGLDRANWNTITGQEVSRRIKIKTSFTEGAVGVEMGLSGAKKRPSRAKVADLPEIADVPDSADGEMLEALES